MTTKEFWSVEREPEVKRQLACSRSCSTRHAAKGTRFHAMPVSWCSEEASFHFEKTVSHRDAELQV